MLALAFSFSVMVVASAWGDYAAGHSAYLEGNFAKALTEYKGDGSPKSMYELGYMYSHGEGVELNLKEAAEWYRKSAEKGYAPAQYRLGGMYAGGYGVGKDAKEAAKWYRKASLQGFVPAKDALKKLEEKK